MKINIVNKLVALVAISVTVASCAKKLDLTPEHGLTSDVAYSTPLGYKEGLAKVYGAFALTGNAGPAGDGDIQGIDEGTSDFFRLYWKAQELSTDEAVVAWGDPGIQDFHNMNWSSSNPMLTGLYYRSMYQIGLANEFLRQSTDDKLSSRGITGSAADSIRKYRPEVRFLRAYQYSVLMDLFGNPPFITETSPVVNPNPPQISRSALFTYVESELVAIAADLPAARSNEYGRVDQAAAWALLARVYLNAEVYTGTQHYSDAATYAKKVIDAGYSLISDYRWLMLADNNLNTSEFIFTINYDGQHTQGYGGTTFLTHASVGGNMNASNFGINGGWAGIRTTRAFVSKFPDISGFTDTRAEIYQNGQNEDIASLTTFTDGYAISKFKNVTRTGTPGPNNNFVDIDMPLFRLAEMYLIYAEAVTRVPAAGNPALALSYVNALRTRAYGNTNGNITSVDLTTDYILDERSRELYWEGLRRSDLIRYNKFVEGTYLWPWKGGVAGGTSVETFRKLYPIPSSDINANRSLTQNPGY